MADAALENGTTEAVRDSSRWIILITVIVGTFLGRLDQTIVNLALPKIINDFSITVSAAGWIATAYILANAVFVPIWGKLGDTIGRKRVYMMGFGIFIFGSVLAGLAWNLSSLLVFRVIQAIASSADYPTAMAIIAVTFVGAKERAQALGIWSSSFAAAAVFGPLIGGPLIDNFGWRSVFLLNLPVGLIGLFMALVFVPESHMARRENVSFDWFGAGALGVTLSALVLVLDKGLDWGWFSTYAFVCYGVVALFGALFYVIEKHTKEPIVDLKFFRNGIFVSAAVNNFIVFMGLMGSIFLIPIFAQTFLGYDATQSGFLFIPMAIGLMLAAPIGGALTGRVPSHIVVAASTFMAGASMWFFSLLDVRSTALDIMIPLGFMAFGLGFGMSQRTNAIASAVSHDEIGVASSVLALVRNIAGAFGIAVFATILQNATEAKVFAISSLSTLNVHTPQAIAEFTSLITLKAQVDAYGVIYTSAALLLIFGSIIALFTRLSNEKQPTERIIIEG